MNDTHISINISIAFHPIFLLSITQSKFANQPMEQFLHGCATGKVTSAQRFSSKNDCDMGLVTACYHGHMPIVKLMVAHGANYWNLSLLNACLGSGDINIIEFLLEKGANNWNCALECACTRGHLHIAQLMLAKGAENYSQGLSNACRHGHMEIIELMLRSGARNYAILDEYKISVENLVWMYGLSLSLVRHISPFKHTQIQRRINNQRVVLETCILDHLGQITLNYICH